jgi:hypothetical protein
VFRFDPRWVAQRVHVGRPSQHSSGTTTWTNRPMSGTHTIAAGFPSNPPRFPACGKRSSSGLGITVPATRSPIQDLGWTSIRVCGGWTRSSRTIPLPARRRSQTMDHQRWQPFPDPLAGVLAPGHRLAARPAPPTTAILPSSDLEFSIIIQVLFRLRNFHYGNPIKKTFSGI